MPYAPTSVTQGVTAAPDLEATLGAVEALAGRFAGDRRSRQLRRQLEAADFVELAATGFQRAAVRVEEGGAWKGTRESVRPIARLLRALAKGDSSVALVSSMHPSVLSFWLATPEVGPEHQAAWDAQRRWLSGTVKEGAWWGTITSEPGSSGDVLRTRTVARPSEPAAGQEEIPGRHYRITGDKHFGSGSGVTSFMLTSALPEGESEPDWFFLDVRGAVWDGSTGMTLIAPWDGHGMTATQSHGMRFVDFPAVRFAAPGMLTTLQARAGGVIGCWFTAVIAGVMEVAVETARAALEPRKGSLGAFEQVEWARARTEAWLVDQALEGMLRAVEASAAPDDPETRRAVLYGKTAVAELAETILTRLCRVMGGGTFARYSPFGHWFEDVRALGFLRPPWSLAFERLIEAG